MNTMTCNIGPLLTSLLAERFADDLSASRNPVELWSSTHVVEAEDYQRKISPTFLRRVLDQYRIASERLVDPGFSYVSLPLRSASDHNSFCLAQLTFPGMASTCAEPTLPDWFSWNVLPVTPKPPHGPTLHDLLEPYRHPFGSPDVSHYGADVLVTAELYGVPPLVTSSAAFGSPADTRTDGTWVNGGHEMAHMQMKYTPTIRVAYDLEKFSAVRDDLLRLIGGIRAAIGFMLMLVLAALARRLSISSFVLILVATYRCYGHRSEPDDHALPARRSITGTSGEPSARQ